MNGPSPIAPSRLGPGEPTGLREIWPFLTGMGVALMVLGAIAVGSSFVATPARVVVFGVLLLLGALFQVVTALWGRIWRGFSLHLLAGVLYFIAGVFLIENPLEKDSGLTLVVATYLLVGGILRIALSVVERFVGWGWMSLNGVVSFSLGLAMWKQWPLAGPWLIGLFVGIEMLFGGLSWLLLGLAVRATPGLATDLLDGAGK